MSDIRLLDGSIGQELVNRFGGPLSTMWSTDVLIERPDLVLELHTEYFDVGATIATTNTYAILQDRLDFENSSHDIKKLWDSAISAAVTARDKKNSYGSVAGSIGPLVGSYVPELCPPPIEAEVAYTPIVDALSPHVDLLLIETMSSVSQAMGALRAVKNVSIPIWLALSVDDFDGTKLRSGEALSDIRTCVDNYRIDAILINCSRPEAVNDGVKIIGQFGLPFGAYANGFTVINDEYKKINSTVAALKKRLDLTDKRYVDEVFKWIDAGATIVGGCCEIGPSAIKALSQKLTASGFCIV